MILASEVNGRFGNQLHQICTGYAHAKDTNRDFYIAGNHFKYQDCLANTIPTHHIDHTFDHCWPESFYYNPIPPSQAPKLFLRGYCLSYKYHAHRKKELRDLLDFNAATYDWAKQIIGGTKLQNPTAIHVRKDDYLSSGYYYSLQPEYYKRCMDHLGDATDGFVIFSDDLNYVREHILPLSTKPTWISETNNFAADNCAMRLFPYKIIANSSFSWMAAYFSDSKAVLYPSEWMYHKGFNLDDYCPPEWTRITVK